MGTIKRDTQIRSNQKRKRQSKSSTITRAWAPAHLTQVQTTARPTPLASDASSASLDPSGPQTRVPSRPTPLGLGRQRRFARSPSQYKASDARRPYPRCDRRSDSHITAGRGGDYSNHPGHCSLTSFTMQPYLFYCGVLPHSERGMGEINQRTICCLLPLLTGQAAVSPIRPPRLQQGSVTLHRSSHAVSHASRTRWASFYRVGTVASPFDRGNLQSLMYIPASP